MDKNQIHIDELVRQKLGGAEESERPGAWLHMRDLLDKQMPTKAPAAFNWRRMMAVVTGVAVLATVGITGYEMSTSSRPDMPVADASGNGGVFRNAGASLARNAQLPQGAKANTAAAPQENATVSSTGTVNTAAPLANTQASGNNVNTATQPASAGSQGNTASTNNANTSRAVGSNAAPARNTQPVNKIGANSTVSNNIAANTQQTLATGNNGNQNSNPTHSVAVNTPTVGSNRSNTSNDGSAAIASVNNNSNRNTANTTANTAPVQPAATQRITVQVPYMKTVERYNAKKGYYQVDVVEQGYMAMEREVPAPTLNEQFAANSAPVNITTQQKQGVPTAPVPNANLNANASGAKMGISENLVPLSSARVSSERKGQGWANTTARLDEMVKNAKFNMSQVRFYPGVIIGVNSALSGHGTMNGFHLGVTGHLVFGDRWSLMSELKFMQRFNSGVTVNDNYVDSKYIDPGTQMLQNDSVQHYFKFSTLNNLSLPISLRYNFNRFNVYGGVNLAYFFAINTEEVDRVYKTTSAPISGTGGITYNWREGAPKVSVTDFGPRFGMGYLLGASYELSPAIQVDLRMSQQLIDNAKTPGAKIISQEIYKMPTLQMSILYRFSSNRHLRGR